MRLTIIYIWIKKSVHLVVQNHGFSAVTCNLYYNRVYVDSSFFVDGVLQVISRNLVKTFQKVEVYAYPFIHEKDPRKNRKIPLTLGKRELEYKRGNCGIFLYWHGRLIEVNSLLLSL